MTGDRVFRYESRSFLKLCGWIMAAKLVMMRGGCVISVSMSTLRLGVNGSGRRMLRGNALSIKLRIWMQFGGMTSQNM